jgi:cell division control protein 7
VKRIRLTSKPHLILKEIELLERTVGCPNVVQLKDLIYDPDTQQTTIVTNFCESDDFKSVLRMMSPRDIQGYMRELLIALAELENLSLIHRDVKPGNFLYDAATGRGLLIDLGLAQTQRDADVFASNRTRRNKGCPEAAPLPSADPVPYSVILPDGSVGTVSLPRVGLPDLGQYHTIAGLPPQPHGGTHGYRAPEVLFPVDIQTPKVDVWSAGVILLQLLTGRTGMFRGKPTTDAHELMAIRAYIGTEEFIAGCAKIGVDFSLGPGAPMPVAVSIEDLTRWNNDDLFAIMPPSSYDLCRRLLAFAPQDRPFASEALKHPFFAETLPDTRSVPDLE